MASIMFELSQLNATALRFLQRAIDKSGTAAVSSSTGGSPSLATLNEAEANCGGAEYAVEMRRWLEIDLGSLGPKALARLYLALANTGVAQAASAVHAHMLDRWAAESVTRFVVGAGQ